jgi:hypothetical protein
MGRNRTGITTKEVKRIELGYMLREGFIKKGETIYFTLTWTGGSNISVTSVYNDDDQYLELNYTLTDYRSDKKYEYNYQIELTFVPSNLSAGSVPYLVCPESGKRCRILYKAYGSHIWKSREAYNNTIFYESQVSSKYSKYNDEYWRLEKELERLRSQKRWQTHYDGKETKRYKRYKKLKERQEKVDMLRFHPDNVPKSIKAFMFNHCF